MFFIYLQNTFSLSDLVALNEKSGKVNEQCHLVRRVLRCLWVIHSTLNGSSRAAQWQAADDYPCVKVGNWVWTRKLLEKSKCALCQLSMIKKSFLKDINKTHYITSVLQDSWALRQTLSTWHHSHKMCKQEMLKKCCHGNAATWLQQQQMDAIQSEFIGRL